MKSTVNSLDNKVNMWYLCYMTLSVLEPSTLFFQVLWPMLWPHHQIVTVWLITSDPNSNYSKNREMKSKSKEKIKMRKKNEINKIHFLWSWHEANMWCPYCIMLLCFRTFYFLLLSPMINIVTAPLDVTDVTVWQITF